MPTSGKEDEFRIGFLAAIEVPERGYVGGLLVTNRFGRPLEFQCTTPVKPNRTQEILYGPTLIPFVLGELIRRTLVEKIGVKPHLVLTESSDILEVRNHVSLPVAWLDDVNGASTAIEDAAPESDDDAADQSGGSLRSDRFGRKRTLRRIAPHFRTRRKLRRSSPRFPRTRRRPIAKRVPAAIRQMKRNGRCCHDRRRNH